MHYNTLKTLIPKQRPSAVVGEFSPTTDLFGKPTHKFTGKHVASGKPAELDGSKLWLTFLLSDISVSQSTGETGLPGWITQATGIPVPKPIGMTFSNEDEPFETAILYSFVSIFEPEDPKSEVTSKIFVSKDGDHCSLHIYKSHEEIAELVKVIVSGCRVTVTVGVEGWSTGYLSYLSARHQSEAREQVQIRCNPGIPSPQYSSEDIELFVSNQGTDTEGDLAEPSGDIYSELRSINRQLASFQRQIGWIALAIILAVAFSGALFRSSG